MPSFYPALFASVAGLLEAFGVMVFERIRYRAEDGGEESSQTQQGEEMRNICGRVGGEGRAGLGVFGESAGMRVWVL